VKVAAAHDMIPADPRLDPEVDRAMDMIRTSWDHVRQAIDEDIGTLRFALPRCDLEVSYAGQSAAKALCKAFAHLEVGAAEPQRLKLRWRIADASCADGFPILPSPPQPLHPLGSLHRNPANSILIERRRGFATALDVEALELTTIVDGTRSIDTDLAAKPLLRFLLALLLREDIVLCHAALIGGIDRGLLVAGRGGSGKSTIAAAALSSGAGFCSDDFVALEQRNGELIGHCLYSTIMLTSEQIGRFSALAGHAARLRSDTFGKHLIALAGPYPGQIRASLSIDAVAVPEITDSPCSELVPGRRADMLRAITPSSVMSSPWREPERTRFLLDKISLLSPMIYRSGSNFDAIAEPLRERYGF
jgi:hypothetical protein